MPECMSAADGDSLQTHSTLMGTQVEGDAPLLPHECFRSRVGYLRISRKWRFFTSTCYFFFFFFTLFFFSSGGTREEWQSVARGSASVSWSCMCSVEHIKCATCMSVGASLPRDVCRSLYRQDRTGIFYYFSKVHISRRYVTRSPATRYCASDATSVKRVEKAGGAAARMECWRLGV